MARGGSRPGSGRKPGPTKQLKAEARERVAATGMTPLEVIIAIMEHAYQNEDHKGALAAAKEAAPYVHPRLSSQVLKVEDDLSKKTEAELRAELEELRKQEEK